MEREIRKKRLVRSLNELEQRIERLEGLDGGAHRDLAAQMAFNVESIRDILLIKSPIALAKKRRTAAGSRAV